MNGYICYYRNKKVEVYAETSFAAQEKAAAEMKAKKRYDVTVVLAELNVSPEGNGEQVTHDGSILG
jgi:hypothetical protein